MTGRITLLAIPADATVQSLVPGKPDDLEDLARAMSGHAGAFTEGARALRRLDSSSWTGQAADAFRTALSRLPRQLDDASDAFTDAAKAVRTYKHVLITAQATAKDVIEHDAPAARTASRNHHLAVDDYNTAQTTGDTTVARPPASDPGQSAMRAAADRVNNAREDVHEAAHIAHRKLTDAGKNAPDKPSQFLSFLKGLGEGSVGLLEFVAKANPMYVFVDPKGFVENQTMTLDALVGGARDPVGFGKAVVDWDTWRDDPARAMGHLAPNLALAAATKGAAGSTRRTTTSPQEAPTTRPGLRDPVARHPVGHRGNHEDTSFRSEHSDDKKRNTTGREVHVTLPDGAATRNPPAVINGRDYAGHALDRMQGRGIMPSVVEDTILHGDSVPGKRAGTSAHYNHIEKITVITDTQSGRVVTVAPGIIKQ